MGVDLRADSLEDLVGLGKVLVVGAFALAQVRHRIEPQAIDTGLEPEVHRVEDGAQHLRIVEIQIGLVGVEPVPVVRAGFRVPRPVRLFGVEKDDAGAGVSLIGIAPNIESARGRARLGRARALKPGVLVRGVVDDELGDDSDAAGVGGAHEAAHVGRGAVVWMHAPVLGDVIAVVAQGRRIERQQPDRRHAQFANVVQLFDQTAKVADAVVVGVIERLDVGLVDHGVAVPVIFVAVDHPPAPNPGGTMRHTAPGATAGSNQTC